MYVYIYVYIHMYIYIYMYIYNIYVNIYAKGISQLAMFDDTRGYPVCCE